MSVAGAIAPWRRPGRRPFAPSAPRGQSVYSLSVAGSLEPPDHLHVRNFASSPQFTGVWGVDMDNDFSTFVTGNSAVVLLPGRISGCGIATPAVAIDPTQIHHVRALIRASSNAPVEQVVVTVRWYGVAGGPAVPGGAPVVDADDSAPFASLSTDQITAVAVASANVWQYVGKCVSPPPNAVYAHLEFETFGPTTFAAWLDHMTIKPTALWFAGSSSADQVFTTGLTQRVVFDQASFAPVLGGQITFDTANVGTQGRYIARRHHVMQFIGSVLWASGVDQNVTNLIVRVNGVDVASSRINFSGTAAIAQAVTTGPIELMTNDYVELCARQQTGGDLTITAGTNTWFRGHEIGIS